MMFFPLKSPLKSIGGSSDWNGTMKFDIRFILGPELHSLGDVPVTILSLGGEA